MITPEKLDEIEEGFYSESNMENYNLAEWARLIIPSLIKEIREQGKQIKDLKDLLNAINEETREEDYPE